MKRARGLFWVVVAAGLLAAGLVIDGSPTADAELGDMGVLAAPLGAPSSEVQSFRYVDNDRETDTYPGNFALYEDFEGEPGTPLDEHRSNWGKVWTHLPNSGFKVGAGGAASSQTAIAPIVFNLETTMFDLRAVLDPEGGRGRVYFLGEPEGDHVLSPEFRAQLDPTGRAHADPYGMASAYYVEVRKVEGQSNDVIELGFWDGTADQVIDHMDEVDLPSGELTIAVEVDTEGESVHSGVPAQVVIGADEFSEELSGMLAGLDDHELGPDFNAAANALLKRYWMVGIEGSATFRHLSVWDPLEIDVQVPEEVDGPLPVMVAVHGGGFRANGRALMAEWLAAAAERGYVGVSIDYTKGFALAASTFAPNSHRLDGASGSFDLVIDGVEITGIASLDPAVVEAAINFEMASNDRSIRADAWVEPALNPETPGATWLTWDDTEDLLAYPAVEGVGIEVEEFDDLISQMESTPACLDVPSWVAQDAAPILAGLGLERPIGGLCLMMKHLELERCAVEPGFGGTGFEPLRFPPISDLCDQGMRRASQLLARAAVEDAQAAIRWLKQPATASLVGVDIDAEAIFIAGSSAGGIIATTVATRPTDSTGGPEDWSGPNSGGGIDATVAGAVPNVSGWSMNGDGTVPPGSAPIQFIQDDVDYELPYYLSAGQSFILEQIVQIHGNGGVAEYAGVCGAGHGPPATPDPRLALVMETTFGFTEAVRADDLSSRPGMWSGVDDGDPSYFSTEHRGSTPIGPAVASDGELEVVAGDFNGDGFGDIYVKHPAGTCDSMWIGDGAGRFRPSPFAQADSAKPVSGGPVITSDPGAQPLVGDFDGDGRDEIFWFTPESDTAEVWEPREGFVADPGLSGNHKLFEVITVQLDKGYDQAVAGNFGDGRNHVDAQGTTDVYLLEDSPTGVDRLLYGDRGEEDGFKHVQMGGHSFQPNSGPEVRMRVGNFGDTSGSSAFDDILWYGPGSQKSAIWYGATNQGGGTGVAFARVPKSYSNVYHDVIIGDFGLGGDAEGYNYENTDDMLFVRASTGTWIGKDLLIYNYRHANGTRMTTSGFVIDQFSPTDLSRLRYVVGDFDNDTFDDVFWYGPGADVDWLYRGQANASSPSGAGAFTGVSMSIGGNLSPVAGRFDQRTGHAGSDILWVLRRDPE